MSYASDISIAVVDTITPYEFIVSYPLISYTYGHDGNE